MNIKAIAIMAGMLAVAAGVQAAPVFSDNFDSDTLALNAVPTGWTVDGGGAVDVVGPGFFGLCQAGQGNCIDLDGSVGQSGRLTTSLSLTAGVSYVASFDLGGNQRANQVDQVTVNFGASNSVYAINEFAPFTRFSTQFTPTVSGLYSLSFLDNSNNNVGAILDNVSVSPVPEPETYALMAAGLGLMALVARRRKQA